jgi:hypothetical protein
MSATAEPRTLAQAADELVHEAAALRAIVCEDAPLDRPIHVETLGEDAADLRDAACDLRGALPDLRAASARYLDADACLARIDARERMRELDGVLLPRGGGWHPWIAVMRDQVRRCRQAIRGVANALIRAWHEIARRSE